MTTMVDSGASGLDMLASLIGSPTSNRMPTHTVTEGECVSAEPQPLQLKREYNVLFTVLCVVFTADVVGAVEGLNSLGMHNDKLENRPSSRNAKKRKPSTTSTSTGSFKSTMIHTKPEPAESGLSAYERR